MDILNFPDNVIEDIYDALDQRSLVNIKYSCRFFDFLSNTYLLKRIYLFNENTMTLPQTNQSLYYSKAYTFIPFQKLDLLSSFLEAHPRLIDNIQEVVFQSEPACKKSLNNFIDTCKKHQQYNGNITQVKFDEPPSSYTYYIFGGGDRFPTYESYLSYAAKQGKCITLYENDETMDESIPITSQTLAPILKPPFKLKSIQIFSPSDIDVMCNTYLEIEDLEIALNNVCNTPLESQHVVSISNSLSTLKIQNDKALDYLLSSLTSYISRTSLSAGKLFPHLRNFTFFMRDTHFDEIKDLLSSINMANISSFELKFKRTSSLVGGDYTSLASLLNTALNPLMKSLSIINLNNHNMLANNIFYREIFEDYNPCFALLNHLDALRQPNHHLHNLVLCLNTFVTVVDPVFSGSDSYTRFVVSQEYMDQKQNMFDSLVKNFPNLRRLTIPDFLFNWLPFLSFPSEVSNINSRFNHETAPVNFQSPATAVIRELYARFPNLEHASLLKVYEQPAHKQPRRACDEEMMKKYFDLLIPVLTHLCKNFPQIIYINLGGFAVEVHRSSIGLELAGVYDNWRCSLH